MCDTPKTLVDAVKYFSNIDLCNEYMKQVKWPEGKITCPKCGGDNIGELKTRRMLRCRAGDCRKQFSYKVGTIFEDSPLGLDKWFVAVWCTTNCKNGISSYELARDLGITQKSAWHMLHRIRLAMQDGSLLKMTGTCEADETFVGGKAKNMHKFARATRIKGGGEGDCSGRAATWRSRDCWSCRQHEAEDSHAEHPQCRREGIDGVFGRPQILRRLVERLHPRDG